ncbi:MAG TPA: hypothetical protein VF805_03000 [Anaeromyxobacteraceae bacterium]
MELTDTAARALAVVRREGRELRFAVDEICHSERYRLSVRYRAPSGEEVRLGLLYGTDEAALLALGEALAGSVGARHRRGRRGRLRGPGRRR